MKAQYISSSSLGQLDLTQGLLLLTEAKRVLSEEASAIQDCLAHLDEAAFARAVQLISECRGRTVVTGMGKSGSIGRKFAGTLSSTGSPALFLHPAEGQHGDLGVLTKGDVVCAFSYSGETDELLKILPVIDHLGVPIVTFTSRESSTLGRASAVVLNVAVDREACPLNLAPTTSTTLMLALSDALAIVVMQAKPFTRSDYARIHPAGSLGRRLVMRVRDVMRSGPDVAVVNESETLLDAMHAVTRAHAGAALVVDDKGKLVGMLADGDFRRAVLADPTHLARPVELAMNRTPGTISESILAAEGLKELERFHPDPGATVGEAPVVDELGHPVGMLTLKDLVRAGITTL